MTLIVTWLWQGLAIAWITAAAVRAMPRLNAATRHAVWWLALAAVRDAFAGGSQRGRKEASEPRPAPADAAKRFRTGAEKGLLKILSKMGISTLSSYCGGQIFEILGLGHEVVATCFDGTASPIGGIGFEEIAEDVLARHRAAFVPSAEAAGTLPDFGRVRFRKDGEEYATCHASDVAYETRRGAGD